MKSDNIDSGEYILCTGLFEKFDKDLNYYKNLFEKNLDKEMVCTNPDLIVDRGDVREFCAGSVAKIFEKIGGKVIYFGKPYPEIYNFCIKKNEKVLAIGDNIRTDIIGANKMKFDSLFIIDGVHIKEFLNTPKDSFEDVFNKYKAQANYYQERLSW